ncbi:MAG: hypothetical protein DRR19_33565, partial [Candidatus Parabeggiatoa sp. nov. 1]
ESDQEYKANLVPKKSVKSVVLENLTRSTRRTLYQKNPSNPSIRCTQPNHNNYPNTLIKKSRIPQKKIDLGGSPPDPPQKLKSPNFKG